MERREFIRKASKAVAASACLGASAAISCGKETPAGSGGERPNIILFVADNLGWKDLGCFGNTDIKTPNIDWLATGGIRFTNAFITSSSCSPSRASIITGQHSHTNGVTGLTHIHKRLMLSPFAQTLAEVLSENGYTTGFEGKWHVSPYLPTSWFGYQERLSGMMPDDFFIHSSEKATAFIEENKDHPFYLELNYLDTHRDSYGEFHFADGFEVDPDTITVPDYYALPYWPEIKADIAKYYSKTSQMDKKIGEVLRKLDELGLTENTLVCFLSDNGAQFPGGIMTLYDRGIGTPLIMRWPKKIAAGQLDDSLVSLIDVMPTFLEAAGCKVPKSVQGKSLLELTTGESDEPFREAVFAEMTYHVDYIPMRAARTQKWKYIRNYSDDAIGLDQLAHVEWAKKLCELPNHNWIGPRVPEELYDLENDPTEQHNLVDDPASNQALEKMRDILDRHMRETNDPLLGKEFERNYTGEGLVREEKEEYF
jgi:arylsulfatase A-like enzyme